MKALGDEIEHYVSCYLQQNGLKLVKANYSCKLGEIDLIMKDQETLVFVEVRFRKNENYGSGLETVTQKKQNKVKNAATCYLQQNNLYDEIPCRFDVVSVSGSRREVEWVKDAFWDE